MNPNRSIVVSVLSLLALAPGLSSLARAQEVQWAHYKKLSPEPAGLEVPCGSYGTLVFEKMKSATATRSKVSKCLLPGAEACGTEKPGVYPSPPLLLGATAKAQSWVPCSGGECFSSPDTIDSGKSWVAVIDWDNQHGWSVGWTIDHLANPPGSEDIPVVLFPLYDAGLEPFSGLGATDLHVLKKLCEIAEIADVRDSPPSVINMSFGRLHGGTDPASCDVDTLSCQVARLLRHLTCKEADCPERPKYPRTVPVAAAGNHRRRQVPAAFPDAVAAGALQLGLYRAGRVEASWETPRYEGKAHAWLPGYGICLESSDREEWPAPPGTSYSAAILSGWLAFLLREGPLADPLSKAPWYPEKLESGHRLVHGERSYPANQAVERFLARIFVPGLRACQSLPTSSKQPVELRAETTDFDPDRETSFIEVLDKLVADVNGPAPPDRPCVPCLEIDTGGAAAQGRYTAKRSAAEAKLRLDRLAPDLQDLLFTDFPDLVASVTGITLAELYLRLDGRFFRLEGNMDTVLAREARSLAIASTAKPEDQPSLIYVYERSDTGNEPLRFWSSVPLLVRAEPAP